MSSVQFQGIIAGASKSGGMRRNVGWFAFRASVVVGGIVAESRRLGENNLTRKQHYVPQLHLNRWTVGGVVQPVLVDRRTRLRPQPPKDIAKTTNFYSLPAPDSTMGAPLRWIETHLSRIENDCAHRLGQLERGGAGIVADDGLKRDLAVFLGLQVARIPSNRERHLLLIEGPVRAKREFYRRLVPAMTDAEFHGLLAQAHPDPKVQALNLVFSDVELATAGALYCRQWAVFRTTGPIVTCDDPVVLVAGPPYDRGAMHGVGRSAVVFYPLNPQHLLVTARPASRSRTTRSSPRSRTGTVRIQSPCSRCFPRPLRRSRRRAWTSRRLGRSSVSRASAR